MRRSMQLILRTSIALAVSLPVLAIANETAPTCFSPGKCIVARNFWNGPAVGDYYIPVYGATLFGLSSSAVTSCTATSALYRNGGLVARQRNNCLDQARMGSPFSHVALPSIYRATCNNPSELRTRLRIAFANGSVYTSPLLRAVVRPCTST